MRGPEHVRFVHLTLVLALADPIQVTACYCVTRSVRMQGCSGEERSPGLELVFFQGIVCF